MPTRITYIFSVTTNPEDRSAATQHSGGWTESFWVNNESVVPTSPGIASIARLRAALLPAQGAIIGVRLHRYAIVGNSLRPLGSSTGKFLFPGNAGRLTDLPQVALELAIGSSSSANSARFVLRGMPDEIMKGGEYQPSPAYKRLVTAYCNALVTSDPCFVGRDLLRTTARVLGIAGGVVTLDGAIGAIAGIDFMRILRARDNNGRPVGGTYRITTIVGQNYTVVGLDGITMTLANGFARVDALQVYDIGRAEPSRAVVKKVGRPLEGYRGRQSKRRAI